MNVGNRPQNDIQNNTQINEQWKHDCNRLHSESIVLYLQKLEPSKIYNYTISRRLKLVTTINSLWYLKKWYIQN